jgi:hypothetical protein
LGATKDNWEFILGVIREHRYDWTAVDMPHWAASKKGTTTASSNDHVEDRSISTSNSSRNIHDIPMQTAESNNSNSNSPSSSWIAASKP